MEIIKTLVDVVGLIFIFIASVGLGSIGAKEFSSIVKNIIKL